MRKHPVDQQISAFLDVVQHLVGFYRESLAADISSLGGSHAALKRPAAG